MKEMWKVRKGFVIVLCLIIGIPVISYSAWEYHRKSKERAFKEAVLLMEIAEMGTHAKILGLLEEGRDEKAREVMEMLMVDSAKYCRDLVREGTRIEAAGIYITEGVRDTKEYAERHDLPTVVEHTAEVLQALEQ